MDIKLASVEIARIIQGALTAPIDPDKVVFSLAINKNATVGEIAKMLKATNGGDQFAYSVHFAVDSQNEVGAFIECRALSDAHFVPEFLRHSH